MHGDIRATEELALKPHMQAARSISIMRTSACFRRKLKNPFSPHISVLKIKRYGTGLTQ